MSKRNRAGQGSLIITLSRNTTLTIAYTVDSDEGFWEDDKPMPSFNKVTLESVMCNDSDITNLVEHFEPLKSYILEQISNEEN